MLQGAGNMAQAVTLPKALELLSAVIQQQEIFEEQQKSIASLQVWCYTLFHDDIMA